MKLTADNFYQPPLIIHHQSYLAAVLDCEIGTILTGEYYTLAVQLYVQHKTVFPKMNKKNERRNLTNKLDTLQKHITTIETVYGCEIACTVKDKTGVDILVCGKRSHEM